MQKKRGISLIVLVITIIVMIILAATIIISLNNNGIVNKAQDAVDKTNEKQVEELASLAWAEAYADNVGKPEDKLQPILKAAVEKALTDNNLNKEDYGMVVTTKGVTIAKGWLQTKNRTVVKGDKVLQIGDYVNYVSGVEGYTDENGWQVLGAENGELLIMSVKDITEKSFNSENTLEGGKKAYETGITELNEICAPYGKGAYALGARSITVEDVDRVTGYDKTTYGKGTIYEYGNVVTYKYNGTNKPAYVGSNGVSGTLSSTHSSGFHWYDVNKGYHYVSASDLTNSENNGKEITKLTSTYYSYDVDQETDLAKGTDAYNMLFGNDNLFYYLASSHILARSSDASFGLRYVAVGSVSGDLLVLSVGNCYASGYMVRAVVNLSQDIKLTGSSATGWSIE